MLQEVTDEQNHKFNGVDLHLANLKSKDDASNLRRKLQESFERIWICVHINSDSYDVTAMNYWGGRLEPATADSVLEFVKDIVGEEKPAASKELS